MESPGERKQSMAMGAETETTANDGGGSVGGGGGNSAISVTVGDDANRTEDDGETKMPSVTESTIDNPAVDCRNMRRIIAEDPEWSLATVPLLTELCTEHMVKNFENCSDVLDQLLPKYRAKLLEKISTSLPLKVTANLIDDDGYWRRCCESRWPICDVARHGANWKRMYFERHLESIVENFVPTRSDSAELDETVPLAAAYVRHLEIRQLLPPVKDMARVIDDDVSDADASDENDGPEMDHFEFGALFKQLPHLERFDVTYGVRDCGMNFEWNLFQFTARDCLLLSKCLAETKQLRVLKLVRSKVDDDKIRVLISHILDHPGLEELDLSHNVIGDRGARAIGKFLNNRSVLRTLNLCDNDIHAAGAQAIAHALTKNTTLKTLNMRLNRLSDEGGQAICRALLKNATLENINLGSNDLTEPTASMLSQMVVQNSTVKVFDLSCNRLGPDGGKQLQEGMEENDAITHMDLRLTDCGQESEYCINKILRTNREKLREKCLNETNLSRTSVRGNT